MTNAISNAYLEAVKSRRTYYGISKEQVLPDEKIVALISDAVKYTPSAFNSQSANVLVLLGESHNKLWDITTETLRAIVPADQFSSTADRLGSFKNGCGTVLFFEDQAVVEGLQKQFASYADNFPKWSMQSSGMLQHVVWTLLESEGFGASLQHYNPLIDAEVKKEWNVPDSWLLLAQMPFGKPTAQPGDKEFKPIEERVKVYK
ncbi:nitroreductase [Paenibacillus radicis (ex Gao et al. 2016)]|uniref:Nitroreductase n=1 Tax=Paenibacillus radicis (ex Gao et al. 2016) TaxID=1737354 RepID=A0A917HU15_9BACL|nr:nitroreductase family protein [Paenibacillus radicis (ex Gao et al. 2016)]GGG89145.1 nitroreductase [Paenibacillus radicis (ex Gao et al. 2016)]